MNRDLPSNAQILTLDPKSDYHWDNGKSYWTETAYRGRNLDSATYGRWRDSKDGSWFLCDSLSYSDYSNTKPTNESNVRVFADMFSKGEGSWWIYATGGHDTTAILIRTLAYVNCSEVREVINGLADYPILDENDSSDLEMEREQEGWEDYGRDDWKRTLVSYLKTRFEILGIEKDAQGKEPEDCIDALTDSQLDSLYQHRCQETNVNGGSTCLFEGESHPHFFTDECAYGRSGRSYKGIDRDSWDGYVPAVDEIGKVEYQAGEISGWSPVAHIAPQCPRCQKASTLVNDDTETLPSSLFEAPCPDFGCDVPEQSPNADPSLAEIAAYVLRSWDVGQVKPYNHLYAGVEDPIGTALDRLAQACEEKGDRYTALAFHFRDPSERWGSLMLENKLRTVVRACLKEIVTGDAPKVRTIANDEGLTHESQYKPICCVVYSDSCCTHGKYADKKWCVRQNTRGGCKVHGKK